MRTVLVTGSRGGVGSWTVDRFAAAGREVVGVDRRLPSGTRENAAFKTADLTDYGETRQPVEAADPDAAVHLAAIPNPDHHAGSRGFENNAISTYNVLDAAGAVGARIAWASTRAATVTPSPRSSGSPTRFRSTRRRRPSPRTLTASRRWSARRSRRGSPAGTACPPSPCAPRG